MSIMDMPDLTLSQVANMAEGRLLGEERIVSSVSTNSRAVDEQGLFIALKGERFDAHDFVAHLPDMIAGVMVERQLDCAFPQVLVEDTRLALARFASAWRSRFKLPVIALTGSNGKTTLKEMIAAILAEEGRVMATKGNLNNDLGVPLTLLRLRTEDEFAVIEMGANHFGEIGFLTHLAQPDVAIVNNAGAAHLEGFGNIKGVSRAKGEIFEGLSTDGIAVINADDTYADYWRFLNKERRSLSFGMNNTADVQGKLLSGGTLAVTVMPTDAAFTVQLNLAGRHNAMNALAAIAVVTALEVKPKSIQKGLQALMPVKGRLARLQGIAGVDLIDDSYNANPSSTRAAIDLLSDLPNKSCLVLGDMGELGENEVELHAEMGAYARECGVDTLFCLGKLSHHACECFGEKARAFSDVKVLIASLKENLEENMTVLVKGSRSMKMERVVTALAKTKEGDASC